MHTLGHSGPHEMVPAANGHAVSTMAWGHDGQASIGQASIGQPATPMPPMDPTALCVAILAALSVIILAIARLRSGRATASGALALIAHAGGTVRGPPGSRLGLLITHLSVMRN
jgi:hypothetical protein